MSLTIESPAREVVCEINALREDVDLLAESGLSLLESLEALTDLVRDVVLAVFDESVCDCGPDAVCSDCPVDDPAEIVATVCGVEDCLLCNDSPDNILAKCDDPFCPCQGDSEDGEDGADDLLAILHTTDAEVWAQKLIENVPFLYDADLDLFRGWFANAIETGRNQGYFEGLEAAQGIVARVRGFAETC